MDTGNTGFIMICAALVFIMTPGLAFFYGGLVRRKNVVNTMMGMCSHHGALRIYVDALRIFACFRKPSTAESSEVLTILH